MQEGGGEPPEGNLASAIESQFGSLDNLIAKLSASGAGVQGSGWVVCLLSVCWNFDLQRTLFSDFEFHLSSFLG